MKGTDGFGNPREYQFKLLSALDGLRLVYEYGSVLTNALPQIAALFEAWAESAESEDEKLADLVIKDLATGEGPVLDMIQLIPLIVTPDKLIALCKYFLAGATINGQECDEDGMCELFRGRPHEPIAALAHAIVANFPDYLPFLGNPDDTGDGN